MRYPLHGLNHNTALRQRRTSPRGPKWRRLLEQVEARPDRAVISAEQFSQSPPAEIESVVAELGAADVTVLTTMRPLTRMLPSIWQESLKHGADHTYTQFLDAISGPDIIVDGLFEWRQQAFRFDDLVRRWADVVGAERVVVLPIGSGTDMVAAFEDFLGLHSGTLDREGIRSNASLSPGQAEVLRRVNQVVREEGLATHYRELVRRGMFGDIVERQQTRTIPPLPGPYEDVVRERQDETVANLTELAVPVLADLTSLLTPEPAPAPASQCLDTDSAADMLLQIYRNAASALADRDGEIARLQIEAAGTGRR